MATVVNAHIEGLTAVTDGTRHRYRKLAQRHITAASLGPVPVDTLTRQNVAAWLNSLPLAVESKRNVHSLLSAALSQAVQDGVIPTNVAHGARFPRSTTRRESVFLTRAEVCLIADAVPARHSPLVHFLAGTGLRWSEATALRIRDVGTSRERGSVSVTRAWKEAERGWVVGAPKTARGRRTVSIPATMTTLVQGAMAGRGRDELLFTAQ
ncbi:hypothetical protein D9R06_10910 [Kocuria marina subsp. indica]|uniref:Uncharacterized protein n=1 Tax=Kocuria marina subsp. indica TaxID=1049583 RepID=A0A1X7DTA5_9MICC|nr:hypothetical protein B1B07_10005 [Kocuria indica]RLP57137.1 hypothetical protein D9R06_10910 [Kocuria indica]SMF21058.1 hypothetical protein SAMN06296028_1157 [Kocuria indica]